MPRRCRARAVRHGGYDGVRGGPAAGERRAAARGSGGGRRPVTAGARRRSMGDPPEID
ncbi:hypothetical protein ABZ719_32975 [Streptomyces sp. NPDC006743]|uniref:hypothetical protein n=1 Tax=Streptomyces sp. NPDC006743 TaxID=3154480 RepID=UPI00345201D4